MVGVRMVKTSSALCRFWLLQCVGGVTSPSIKNMLRAILSSKVVNGRYDYVMRLDYRSPLDFEGGFGLYVTDGDGQRLGGWSKHFIGRL